MWNLVRAAVLLVVIVILLPAAQAEPGPYGVSSDNVEYVAFVPFEIGTATGASLFGEGEDRFLVVTSWRSFSIYDISDPIAPELVSFTPLGFMFENEDVASNGEIMLFSEETPNNVLHIWNIEDRSNPVEIATVQGAGNHTTSCILECTWSYGSDGVIVDLRDPAKPQLMEEKWGDDSVAGNDGHDVTEVAPGIVLTSTNPLMLLDARKDPRHPKLLAVAEYEGFVHSNIWPRKGADQFALSSGETWLVGVYSRCSEESAGLTTWDTTGWKKTHTFKEVDTFRMVNGTYVDGNPPANAHEGCSSHWFTTHPNFKNGGLVAASFYNHGSRFLDVASDGTITEVGWFMPHVGSSSGSYWIDDEIVYSVDYKRGFDILRYTG